MRALADSNGSPSGGAGTGGDARDRSFTGLDGGRLHRNRRARAGGLARVQARARSLRQDALRLADLDASASRSFGAAFRLESGPERDAADGIDRPWQADRRCRRDLAWLAAHGNPALVADVAVAFGGSSLEKVHQRHPDLWSMVGELNGAVDRIDCLTARLDHRPHPNQAAGIGAGRKSDGCSSGPAHGAMPRNRRSDCKCRRHARSPAASRWPSRSHGSAATDGALRSALLRVATR